MSLNKELHERLIKRQSTKELKRKAEKCTNRGLWTKEEIDYIRRQGELLWKQLNKLI